MFNIDYRTSFIALAFAAAALFSVGTRALNDPDDPTLTIDLAETSAVDADSAVYLGTVAYGLGYFDGVGTSRNLRALEDYLDIAKSSAGDISISTIGVQLRQITEFTDSVEFQSELDELLGGELQDIIEMVASRNEGHRVQLKLFCGLPDHLSKYPGVLHDAQSGLLEPTEHPIAACAPIDSSASTLPNGNTAAEEWASIMEALARHYRDQPVSYVIGSEPSNYFNGTFDEFLEFAKYTAEGLRNGDPSAEIAILDADDLRSRIMRRTNPIFVPEGSGDPEGAAGGRYDMTIEWYDAPLVQLYLEYIQNNNLEPIDAIQYKQPGRSPFPSVGAFWHTDSAYIDGIIKNLGSTNRATKGPVSLIVSDYPHWHTVCRDDISTDKAWNGGESIWDSEYLAAFYSATELGIGDFNRHLIETNAYPNVRDLKVQLGYLVNWGVDTFFARSCESDGSRPAGFGGAIALTSYRTDLLKPVTLAVSFLDALEGDFVPVQIEDANLFANAAYLAPRNAQKETLTLVLSEFVPTESQVSTYLKDDGEPRIELGHIWNNNYGLTDGGFTRYCPTTKCDDPLQICCTAPAFQDLVYDPSGIFPRNLTRALILEDADPTQWGLPPGVVERMLAVQSAGQANRQLARSRDLLLIVKGLRPNARYLVSLNTVDQSVSNAYRDRYDLARQLESELGNCEELTCAGFTGDQYEICVDRCLDPFAEPLRAEYSFDSTSIYKHDVARTDSNGVLRWRIAAVRKNSVHLLTLEQDEL